MAENLLLDPIINPVIFYDVTRAVTDVFRTKHIEYFPFGERGHAWQQPADYKRIWHTGDIINLQFSSQFDPIVVHLVDKYGNIKITTTALMQLPDIFNPGFYIFQISMALSGLQTGCYRLKRTLGAEGPQQRVQYSDWMMISSTPLDDTILIQYWNTKFAKDVLFETGIVYQLRVPGWLQYDKSYRAIKDEPYRDQRYNPYYLSSKSSLLTPVAWGDEEGLPVDLTDLIEEIFGLNNVLLDNKPFAKAEGTKFDYQDVQGYRKRGFRMVVEPSINRASRVFSVELDPMKKMMAAVIVEAKVFGDLSGAGSNNTVPVTNIE